MSAQFHELCEGDAWKWGCLFMNCLKEELAVIHEMDLLPTPYLGGVMRVTGIQTGAGSWVLASLRNLHTGVDPIRPAI